MQCVNCQFENMPGTASCVRCGTSMNLGTSVLVLEPPRAGKLKKSIRRWLPWQRAVDPLRNELADVGNRWQAAVSNVIPFDWPSRGTAARFVLPGWSQAHLGLRDRAIGFFFSWLGLLLASLVAFGSTTGGICLGLMIGVHVASLIDILFQTNRAQPRTLTLVGLAFALVVFGGYWSIGLVAGHFLTTRQLIQTDLPFYSGDVVLLRPSAYANSPPRVGDVVVYRNQGFQSNNMPAAYMRHAIGVVHGEWVDRVIAGPGNQVLIENGQVWVDGHPSPYLPLNVEQMPRHLEFTVPSQGAYGIMPSTNPYLPAEQVFANVLQCIVPERMIVGKVVARTWPVWRWWWID